MVALPKFVNISKTFNVTGIHEYHAYEFLYKEENSGSSASEVEETGVRRLVAHIENEVAR